LPAIALATAGVIKNTPVGVSESYYTVREKVNTVKPRRACAPGPAYWIFLPI